MTTHFFARLATALSLTLALVTAHATTQATTADGRHIILEDNGTWKLQAENPSTPTDTANTRTTPASATSVARSGFGVFTFAYDPKKWTVEQHPLSETVEFIFRNSNGSANVKVVTERVQVSLDGLKKVNLQLMQKNDPKAHIDSEAKLTVNGNQGLVIDNVSESFGAQWHSRRFLWSGKQGSVQMIGIESVNLYDESVADINDLIAGFNVVEPVKTR